VLPGVLASPLPFPRTWPCCPFKVSTNITGLCWSASLPGPPYHPGQQVWAALFTEHSSMYWIHKVVKRVINPSTIKLKSQRTLRIHFTVHVSQVKPVVTSSLNPRPHQPCGSWTMVWPSLSGGCWTHTAVNWHSNIWWNKGDMGLRNTHKFPVPSFWTPPLTFIGLILRSL